MPPMSRISDSPTTTTPSAEICWPIPVMFETVRKWLFRSEPRPAARPAPAAGPPRAATRSPPRSGAPPASADSTSAASAARLSLCRSCRSQPFGGRDQRLAVEGRLGELGEDLAADEHQHPVADDQVVQFVAGQQQARAGLGVIRSSSESSSSLDATSTPRVGVMATISTGSLARARATVTFCWLPPDSSRTGWPSPADTRDSRRASGAARCLAAPGADEAAPGDPLGDRHRDVLGRAEQRHEPVRLPVLGDVADARPQRRGPVAGPEPCSPSRTSPASGATAPATIRASVVAPDPRSPVMPDPLPAAHGQRDAGQRARPARRGDALTTRSGGGGSPSGPAEREGARAAGPARSAEVLLPTMAVTRSSLLTSAIGAAEHQLAVPQHRDVGADLEDLLQVVGDVHDRHAGLQLAERSNSRCTAPRSRAAVGSSSSRQRVPAASARMISTTWRCSTVRLRRRCRRRRRSPSRS